MRTGITNLPLHGGNAPKWLFERMKRLGGEIVTAIIFEFGTATFLKKIADPVWFQALGCVLGFDWHSSGLTTTTCGALKEGIKGREKSLGLFICGGKGATSRKTPEQIENYSLITGTNPKSLVYSSKMAAKVDSAALQDGFQLYHQVFFFDKNGHWAVVQQGMNTSARTARRYHWLSDNVADFVCEPHSGIISDPPAGGPKITLNMIAKESGKARETSTLISQERPEKTLKLVEEIKTLNMPLKHPLRIVDLNPKSLEKVLLSTYEKQPRNFEQLLGIKGVGPKTIRSLALISEIVYKSPASISDPVTYSWAHGGKDGYPYPVNRPVYDQSIEILKTAINKAKIGSREKIEAIRQLSFFRFNF